MYGGTREELMAKGDNEHVERLVDVWPGLRSPILVAGFQGWNDAGQGASAAVRWLARHLDGERIARIRPDAFHSFTEMESRPIVRRHGDERVIRWPAHELYAIRGGPGWSADLVAFVAKEPNLRWRTYCQAALAVAQQVGVKRVVTLGAFLAAVPHTRPVPVTGYAWTEPMNSTLESMGALATNYEGPTGIVSVFADAAKSAGIASASLWAAVPHYLPTTANPKAALALLRAVRDLTDLPLDLSRLEDASAFFEAQVSEAVRAKSEVAEHVQELEAEQQETDVKASAAADLPNAADVISAFEDLLRRGNRGGTDA
jgi:proteasome assembly chaperone (PAC2) family protein